MHEVGLKRPKINRLFLYTVIKYKLCIDKNMKLYSRLIGRKACIQAIRVSDVLFSRSFQVFEANHIFFYHFNLYLPCVYRGFILAVFFNLTWVGIGSKMKSGWEENMILDINKNIYLWNPFFRKWFSFSIYSMVYHETKSARTTEKFIKFYLKRVLSVYLLQFLRNWAWKGKMHNKTNSYKQRIILKFI